MFYVSSFVVLLIVILIQITINCSYHINHLAYIHNYSLFIYTDNDAFFSSGHFIIL